MRQFVTFALIVFTCLSNLKTAAATSEPPAVKWAKELEAFKASDLTNPAPKGITLFLGSSSIRLWKTLAADFPGEKVLNRGFGGSHISDSVALVDQLVFPYEPKKIVFYAGDNDLAGGKTPQTVLNDFKSLVEKIRAKLPDTKIFYIAIKPSPSRWKLAPQIKEANQLIADYTRAGTKMKFVDIFTPMLDEKGEPRPELFVEDKLHMNAKGYAIWTRILTEELKE